MIPSSKSEDRKQYGDLSHKMLFSLVEYNQPSLSFPDRNGAVALGFREKAIQISSSYSDLLRSDYMLPVEQIESIRLHGTPRIVTHTRQLRLPSMFIASLILGFVGLLADDDRPALALIMFTLGLILGALTPISHNRKEHFWQVSIQYKVNSQSHVLRIEGKNDELKMLSAALKDHSLKKSVIDDLNMIEVLSPERTFGM